MLFVLGLTQMSLMAKAGKAAPPLIVAAENGNAAEVQRLINEGNCDLNKHDYVSLAGGWMA